jgi:TolB protein
MNNFRFVVAMMAAVGVVAGCSSSTNSPTAHESSATAGAPSSAPAPSPTVAAPATPAAATGVEAAIKDVPWSKVGPGWMLAEWSPVTPHRPGEQRAADEPTPQTVGTTLYLVDPTGDRRYAITTFAPGSELSLVDWSGDGSHALFTPSYVTPTSAISVDLHTGAQTTMPVAGYPSYTRPNGTALLVSTSFNGNRPGTLKRVDRNGNPQFTYPTDDLGGAGQFSGNYAESPDGTQLVLATANLGNQLVPRTDNSLVVMGNDGKVIRRLSTPMPKSMCGPVKWWTTGTLLVHCTVERSSANQLWEVPLDGGAPTPLTALNSGQEDDPGFGGDIGDGDAWKLPSGIFLQSAGACGTVFLSRLTADGHTTRVKIPGVSDDVFVTGAANGRLVVRGQVGCSGTTSLVSYDPAADTSTVLLGPPINGGGVSQAMLYPTADS